MSANTVAVLGGAGYVGTVLTRHLLGAGHDVVVQHPLRLGQDLVGRAPARRLRRLSAPPSCL